MAQDVRSPDAVLQAINASHLFVDAVGTAGAQVRTVTPLAPFRFSRLFRWKRGPFHNNAWLHKYQRYCLLEVRRFRL